MRNEFYFAIFLRLCISPALINPSHSNNGQSIAPPPPFFSGSLGNVAVLDAAALELELFTAELATELLLATELDELTAGALDDESVLDTEFAELIELAELSELAAFELDTPTLPALLDALELKDELCAELKDELEASDDFALDKELASELSDELFAELLTALLTDELPTVPTELDDLRLDDELAMLELAKELEDDFKDEELEDEELGGVCPEVHSMALRIISIILGSAKFASTWPMAV